MPLPLTNEQIIAVHLEDAHEYLRQAGVHLLNFEGRTLTPLMVNTVNSGSSVALLRRGKLQFALYFSPNRSYSRDGVFNMVRDAVVSLTEHKRGKTDV